MMTVTRRAVTGLLAALAAFISRRASTASAAPARVSQPPDLSGVEFRRIKPQRLPAVYADWDIDPAARIITHAPTGLSFAVYWEGEGMNRDVFARLVGGTPRTEDELAAVADMGMNWYLVFGTQILGQGGA